MQGEEFLRGESTGVEVKGKIWFWFRAVSFFLAVCPAVAGEGGFAERVLKIGTIEFEVGKRYDRHGREQYRLFVTKPGSLDGRLSKIIETLTVESLRPRIEEKVGGEEFGYWRLVAAVLSRYWLSLASTSAGAVLGTNFTVLYDPDQPASEWALAVRNAGMYAAGSTEDNVCTPGLIRGIEFAVERRFREFVESGTLKRVSEERSPFFLVTFLLLLAEADGPVRDDGLSERILFFGYFDEIVWKKGRPDKVKVSIWAIPFGIDTLKFFMRVSGEYSEDKHGMLLEMLESVVEFLFESSSVRERMKPVFVVPFVQDPELAQVAVAASVLGKLRCLSEGTSRVENELEQLIATMDYEEAGRFRGLWKVNFGIGTEKQEDLKEKFALEVLDPEGNGSDGLGIVKLLEGGPVVGLFTPILEFGKVFAVSKGGLRGRLVLY